MAESRIRHHLPSAAYLEKRKKEPEDYWRIIKNLARYLVRLLWKTWHELVPQSLEVV